MKLTNHQLAATALGVLVAGTAGCDMTTWDRSWAQRAPANELPTRDPEPAKAVRRTPAAKAEKADNGKVGATQTDVLAFIQRLEKAEKAEKAAQQPTTQSHAQPAEDVSLAHRGAPAVRTTQESYEIPSEPDVRAASSHPVMAKKPDRIPPRILEVWVGEPKTLDASSSELVSAPVVNMPVPAEDRTMSRPADEAVGLIADLEDQAAADPNNEQLQWRLALMRLAFGKSDCSAGKGLASMPSGSLLRKSICTLVAARRAVDDPITAIDEALATVEELRAELRGRAVLMIPTVALCTKVQAFGVYEEMPDGFLRAYARNQAIAYFEVSNFTSEQMPDGRFRTLLSDRFEILTPEGESLWRHVEPEIEDLSRRRREDFFIAQRIEIPPSVGEGRYVLKVTVEDRLANKQTQSLFEFNVAPSLARSTPR